MNAYATAIYAYFDMFPERVGPLLMKVATLNWTLVNGMPALIYLAVNPTIRRDLLTMFDRRIESTISVTISLLSPARSGSGGNQQQTSG